MKRCSRCIMPDTAQGITLDAEGLCNLCRSYRPFSVKGPEALEQEIAPFVQVDGAHDCIVPLSGGRDSSYALYYAKEVLGLRPVALHNDNDFETDAARANLEAVTRALNVPLVRTQSAECLSKKIVAEKLVMNAPFGPALVVDQTCEACKYGFEAGSYNTARREGVRLVFWGDSTDESTEPYHQLVDQTTPSRWQRLLSPEVVNYLKYKYYHYKMQREYGSDQPPEGLKEIHLFDYVEWDRRVIVETIQKLGWKKPDDSPTTWRIDCSLVPLVNYLTKKAFGVSKIELGFANMVRSGKMDREDALAQVAEIENHTTVTDLENFLKAAGVPVQVARKVLL
jgi:glucosamine--fructose-6-phosphate aminotransferase (isomerizing)